MNIFVYGSGAWGLALSDVLANNKHNVLVYTRNVDDFNELNNNHILNKYLGNIKINENIKFTYNLNDIDDYEIILIAVPSKAISDVVIKLNSNLKKPHLFINATKGLEPTSDQRIQKYLSLNLNPIYIKGLVSILGPGFAKEVVDKNITCVCSVSQDEKVAKFCQNLFSNNYFRVYELFDVIGAEYSSSIKNSIAIASGILSGLGYKENTKAALITRGLKEMVRFGLDAGAKEETFYGLTGVGDLLLTCSSDSSRNFMLGKTIGLTNNPKKVLSENKITVEGIYTTKVINDLAKKRGIEMPIISAIYSILFNFEDPTKVLKNIMLRPLKVED